MCGIVGEYFFKNKCVDHNIELMLDKVKSRGPDYSGFEIKNHICPWSTPDYP
jgi:asparagine synthetase B (glutamine-hydrolysing)